MALPGALDNPLEAGASSSLDEVKRMRNQLSLKLIRSFDDQVDTIIYQTPFVTAYELSNREQWERAEIEGFLYVLRRHGEPRHSFVLVNRKSERHLVEYITPEFQVTLDRHFIFYHSKDMKTNKMNNIRGLWFFDEKECRKSFENILSVVINPEPLSGFDRSEKTCAAANNNRDVPPKVDEPASHVYAPARSPQKLHIEQSAQVHNRNENIASSIMAALQIKKCSGSSTKRTPDARTANSVSRQSSQQAPQPTEQATAEHVNAYFHPFNIADNRMNNARRVPQRQMKSNIGRSDKALDEGAVPPPPPPPEPTITITYEMLSRAFNEAILSEEFVSLVWMKMQELDSRRSR